MRSNNDIRNIRNRYIEVINEPGFSIQLEQINQKWKLADIPGAEIWREDLETLNIITNITTKHPADINEYLNRIYNSIEFGPLKKPVYCGYYFTREVNAGMMEFPEGYLFLVNRDLLLSIYTSVLPVILSGHSWTENGRRLPPAINYEQAAKFLRDNLDYIMDLGKEFHELNSTLLSELMWEFLVTNSAIGYVMAHEYCHASLGHKTSRDDNKTMVHEVEADEHAMNIYISRAIEKYTRNEFERAAWLTGPPLVMIMSMILEKRGYYQQGGHPSSLSRLVRIKEKMEAVLKNTIGYKLSWNFISHYINIAEIAGMIELRQLYVKEIDWK